MKRLLLLLATLTFISGAFASANQPVEDAFQRYWSAYVRKDFAKAATEILPADLDALKAELLPVFLGAQNHKQKEAQQMVTTFFGRAVGKARESLSAAEVFAGLQRVVVASNPDFFEVLKEAKTSIVFVRRPDADNAEVHFQVTLRGESDMDTESLTNRSGRWWVKLQDAPRETAAEFKAIFAAGA